MSSIPDHVPGVGDLAPDFSLPAGIGSPITLSEVYRTHHVVLYFVRRYT